MNSCEIWKLEKRDKLNFIANFSSPKRNIYISLEDLEGA